MAQIQFKNHYDAIFYLKLQTLLFTESAASVAKKLGVSTTTISLWKTYRASIPSKYFILLDKLVPSEFHEGLGIMADAMLKVGMK